MALKPEVVCLDEPTSALDPLLTTHVRNTIMQLADDGYIVLVATHDTTLLKKMPCTIYLMQNGKIIEWNRQAAQLIGLGKNNVINKAISRVVIAGDDSNYTVE